MKDRDMINDYYKLRIYFQETKHKLELLEAEELLKDVARITEYALNSTFELERLEDIKEELKAFISQFKPKKKKGRRKKARL